MPLQHAICTCPAVSRDEAGSVKHGCELIDSTRCAVPDASASVALSGSQCIHPSSDLEVCYVIVTANVTKKRSISYAINIMRLVSYVRDQSYARDQFAIANRSRSVIRISVIRARLISYARYIRYQ